MSRMKDWIPSIVSMRRGETRALDGVERGALPEQAERIARWLEPQDVVLGCDATSGDGILGVGASAIAKRHGLSVPLLGDALRRREQAASTALGHGFAVPHARLMAVDQPLTLYLRAAQALPFGAPDAEGTRHFLFIVVPSDGDPDDHLQLLAGVSRLVANRRFRRRLEHAETASEAMEAFRSGIAKVRDAVA